MENNETTEELTIGLSNWYKAIIISRLDKKPVCSNTYNLYNKYKEGSERMWAEIPKTESNCE